MAGEFFGKRYRVAGRVVLGAEEAGQVYYWTEFNLVGPDLTATEWADLVKPIPGRVVFVDTTGASFPHHHRVRAFREGE
jgi:hypothetical protein